MPYSAVTEMSGLGRARLCRRTSGTPKDAQIGLMAKYRRDSDCCLFLACIVTSNVAHAGLKVSPYPNEDIET